MGGVMEDVKVETFYLECHTKKNELENFKY